MKKRTASLFLALALCLGLCVPALAFTDVPGDHYAYAAIMDCSEKGIVGGYSNGSFQPGKTVTNAQFATMLARAFYADDIARYNTEPYLSQGTFMPNYMALFENGIFNAAGLGSRPDTILGYLRDKSFMNKGITRQIMATLITNILAQKGYAASDAEKSAAAARITDYQDHNSIYASHRDAVANVYALGIIGGYSDGTFRGLVTMNRGQAAAVIHRMTDYVSQSLPNSAPQSPAAPSTPSAPAQPPATAPSVPAGNSETYPEVRCLSCSYLMRQAGSTNADVDLNMGGSLSGGFFSCDLCHNAYICGQCSKDYYDARLTLRRHEAVCGTGEAMVPMADLCSPYYKNSVYHQRLKNVTLTGDYRRDILAVAESQIGYTEGNDKTQLDGSYNGRGDYSEYNWLFSDDAHGAWCSEFASWCARQANIPSSILGSSRGAVADQFGGTAYTWSETVFAGGSYMPQPGDLMLLCHSKRSDISTSKAMDHTAIVESVSQRGDQVTITVIDGNSNSSVRRHDYDYTVSDGLVGYFVAPDYSRG